MPPDVVHFYLPDKHRHEPEVIDATPLPPEVELPASPQVAQLDVWRKLAQD